jgi:hypothetical protein
VEILANGVLEEWWLIDRSGAVGLVSGQAILTNAYHDQKATKKPNHEKKKTRPYMLRTLKKGTDRALWLIGLTSGALKSTLGLNILAVGPSKG